MTTKELEKKFQERLKLKTEHQKIVFSKEDDARPHNGGSQKITEFLEALQKNDDVMKQEVEKTSRKVANCVKEYSNE